MLRTWGGLFVAPPPPEAPQEVTSDIKFTDTRCHFKLNMSGSDVNCVGGISYTTDATLLMKYRKWDFGIPQDGVRVRVR